VGERSLAILILVDREWSHPEAGGTGTTLRALVSRWIDDGHRVTIIAGAYEGAVALEQPHPRLEIHRMGTRLTVFPRAWRAVRRGIGADADVVLEVINGIAFFTPLWRLRKPTMVLLQHVHQHHYVTELGWRGRIGALLLERLPLRHLYRRASFLTISQAVRTELIELGVPAASIEVVYLGVEPDGSSGPRASEPTLLYLGRLKRYKRLELLLDVLDAAPDAVLEVAGDGDHRAAFEAEVRRRGLESRVVMHGFVPESSKPELYRRAWLNVTASSAEGWGLTVMEAAVCGTPSAALRVGGLGEAIVDGETGLLADGAPELAERVGELLASPERRELLGASAAYRARQFSWDRSAGVLMGLLHRAVERHGQRDERLPVAKVAAATFANGAVQLGFTVVLARLLGIGAYGELAALVSVFLIMLATGQALQLAAARQVALGRFGGLGGLADCLAAWMRTLILATVAAAAVGVLLRVPLANAIGIHGRVWAAAAIPPTCTVWLMLSLQRGVLQGLRADRAWRSSLILEPAIRLAASVALVLAGAGVTGAYLGTPIALTVTAGVLAAALRRRLPDERKTVPGRRPRSPWPLRGLLEGAWAPVAGLTLLALIQNVDLVAFRHQADGRRAGAYAAAAVAAKAILWITVSIGGYLFAVAGDGAGDPRRELRRPLQVLAAVAVPALALFALAPRFVLSVGFGHAATGAADSLLLLGAAMTLMALAYLAVQYMLAVHSFSFLWVLGAVAVAEPALLGGGSFSMLAYVSVLFGIDCVVASVLVTLGVRARRGQAAAVLAAR
jgi:glycosyltransferase involved in cell wall biosynthesis/O-antigen/teichoic acid export membrane protein